MRFNLLACSMLVICGISARAASTHMIVELESGGKYSFLLAERPIITFTDNAFEVNKNSATSYALGDVKSYYFGEDVSLPSGMRELDRLPLFYVDDSGIHISQYKGGALVQLFSVAGETIASATTDTSGETHIPLPQLAGVYMVVVGGRSFKIIKK